MILAPLLKLPKNVGDLGKFIVAKSFKSCPKCKKSPNLVTLLVVELVHPKALNGSKGSYIGGAALLIIIYNNQNVCERERERGEGLMECVSDGICESEYTCTYRLEYLCVCVNEYVLAWTRNSERERGRVCVFLYL